MEKLESRFAEVESDLKKIKQAPIRCELATHDKLKQHDKQLWLIETKIKPTKKEAPLFFRRALNTFAQEKAKTMKVLKHSSPATTNQSYDSMSPKNSGHGEDNAKLSKPKQLNDSVTVLDQEEELKLRKAQEINNRWMGHDQTTV